MWEKNEEQVEKVESNLVLKPNASNIQIKVNNIYPTYIFCFGGTTVLEAGVKTLSHKIEIIS